MTIPNGDKAATNADESRATGVRYLIVAVCTLSAILLYLHRFCLSFVQQYLQEDLSLTDAELGYCQSAFFISYALAQIPSGFLSDRFGARIMLAIYILVWSAFTALIGFSIGFAMLFGFRLGLGFGQAGAHPTSASVVSKWIPFRVRGTFSSIVAGGGRFGALIAPVLTTYLVLLFIPLSVSSRFESTDLLDPYRLSYQVVQGKDEYPNLGPVSPTPSQADREELLRRLGERIQERLPEPSRQVFRETATVAMAYSRSKAVPLFEELVQSRKAGDPKRRIEEIEKELRGLATSLPGISPLDSEPTKRITVGLNALLDDRELYDPELFGELVVLEREAQRLLEKPRENWTTAEVQRVNRLFLEKVYSDDLRKIYARGWRPVMMVYGSAGLLVAACFWLVQRDRPDRHPWCNRAEIALIERDRPASAPSPHGKARKLPWGRILRSPSLWLISWAQFFTNIGWVFIVTWMPRYLRDVQNAPFELRNWMSAVVYAIGLVGMFFGGLITDWLAKRFSLRWARALPLAVTRFTAAIAYLLFLLDPSPWGAAALFALVAFSTDMGNPSSWAFKQDVGGPFVASILGFGNMFGNLGAAVAPSLVAPLIAAGWWDATFLVLAGAFVLSGLCALGVDASKPIAPPDDDDDASPSE